MKKFFFLFVSAIVLTSCATQTSFNSFYKDHRHKASVTVSTPSFIANMLIPKDEVKEYEAIFSKVRHYRVMIFSEPNMSLDQSFNKFVKRNKYDEIFRINDKGNNVSFYFLKQDDLINEMIMKVADGNSYILLGLKTRMYEEEFNEIVAEANVEVTSR